MAGILPGSGGGQVATALQRAVVIRKGIKEEVGFIFGFTGAVLKGRAYQSPRGLKSLTSSLLSPGRTGKTPETENLSLNELQLLPGVI